MTKRNNEVQNQNGEKTPSVFRSWDRSHSKSHQFGNLDDDRGWGRKLTDTAAQDEGRDFTDHQVISRSILFHQQVKKNNAKVHQACLDG